MSEFKNVKWSLGGCSGRMIQTNQYMGFVADVDTKVNAKLISKAPEMLEMLQSIADIDNKAITQKSFNIEDMKRKINRLIEQATTI